MCNLVTMKASVDEVAAVFRARKPAGLNTGPGDSYPGGPILAIREEAGERVLQGMTWGFPLRLKSMKPESKPKPVNNIADLSSFMWRFIAPRRENRCILPITAFGEAEGAKGAKTRTWFGIQGRPIFGWAGMWKQSDEWGAVCSGLMTDCNPIVSPVHDRMPVLLHEDEHDRWLHGTLDDVLAFQDRCFPPDIMTIERTRDPWITRRDPGPGPLL